MAIQAARSAEAKVASGAELGPLHGDTDRDQRPVRFQARLAGHVRRRSRRLPISGRRSIARSPSERKRPARSSSARPTAPTMGFRGTCDNFLFGPTRNPFDLSRNSGGSSGGSAAAVADGLVPIAEGTDGGGSIRIPASWCGVFGYKASFGRVPFFARPNAFGHDTPFLYEGPLARTVEDAALLLEAMQGYDSRDPYSIDDQQDFVAASRRSVRGMKIACSPDLDVFPVDPRIARRSSEPFVCSRVPAPQSCRSSWGSSAVSGTSATFGAACSCRSTCVSWPT